MFTFLIFFGIGLLFMWIIINFIGLVLDIISEIIQAFF